MRVWRASISAGERASRIEAMALGFANSFANIVAFFAFGRSELKLMPRCQAMAFKVRQVLFWRHSKRCI
jgi:hypothetical protein